MVKIQDDHQQLVIRKRQRQGLSQDFETGCSELADVKFWGILFFKGDHNILR